MRLHRLTVTAFGPFGGTQHVDFDALSADGLFLFHGPTGAGKTSVLDAVCYALYNEVPGTRQGSGAPVLRSDHAADGTLTQVVLDLTVGGRRLEITRRPEQLRRKKKGTGFTKERAASELREYRSGAWEGLSRSHQEIGEEVKQLLGMSREQFCQVVLLPQGEFARFLGAKDAARGELLGRLFDTGRFGAVEKRLAELRRAAEAGVRSGDDGLLALAHRMRQAAGDPSLPEVGTPSPAAAAGGGATAPAGRARDGVPAPRAATPAASARPRSASPRSADGTPGPAPGRPAAAGQAVPAQRAAAAAAALTPGDPGLAEAVLEWAALARSSARERRDIAVVAARTAEHAHRAAQEHADAVRELARLQLRHAEARERADALDAQGGAHEAARERMRQARAADGVVPFLDLRAEAERAHRAAVAGEQRARAGLPEGQREAGAGQLAARERSLREELGSLSAARRAEERAAGIEARLRELEHEARADEDELAEAGGWLDGWEALRSACERRVETAHAEATRAVRLEAETGPVRTRLAAARERDRLTGDAAAAGQRLTDAREKAVTARTTWLDLKERRLDGIAAELAGGLAPGVACKVCGATEHPDPARAAAGRVDRADEEAALAAFQRADARREEAARELQRLRDALARAEADAGGATAAELEALAGELGRSLTEARAAGADLHAAQEALRRAEREHDLRREARQAALTRTTARTTRREQLDRDLAALEEELARARGGEESVARRAAHLERQLDVLAGAVEAVRAAADAADRLKEADARLADAAFRAGFGNPVLAEEAVLGPAARRELQERLDARAREEAAVAAELADPQAVDAAARPAADPEGAAAVLAAATARLREASSAEAAARTRCQELDRLSAAAVTDARRLAPLREEYHRVAELAALAAGTSIRNERRMRLESYVLAARLEQVAAAATARLRRMSAGRYTLVHSDARAGGNARSGLGLHVIDHWTGKERDTATLSGGETFFVSLALALGLADVVTEEAGGVRLDTLFIDEGFGSLDEQTLDEVLDVLDSLRERDRAVGIVSHVADLRRRVPAQLRVVKGRSGSAVRHEVAGAGRQD
ncbi:SMC family ATPase [Streptomyces rectiverticillatus]|uniref:AAA family ATPase n=1 Tax=Streptomyces rectiverticillatus TaxID=173860 RepID=UPI0015C35A94|nr:SMC family ATPase [Streptomyces rectiverticillatus]QLE70912.1 SMC family ATPase [Streptomyces rectiverticillatus]